MDQCIHEVRAQYWKGIIKSCGQRPAGQSAKSWMDENGICEQSYYHWQRKFRQQAYELMKEAKATVPAAPEKTDISFAEIPYAPLPPTDAMAVNNAPVAVIRMGTMSIELTNEISDCILTRILKELSHA